MSGLYDVTVTRTEHITYRVKAESPEDAEADMHDGIEIGSKTKDTTILGTKPVTSGCPNCWHDVEFVHPNGSPARRAEIEDISPWTCPGCGIHGYSDDLATYT